MSQIFPKWANKLPIITAIIVVLSAVAVIGLFWYYGSPKYIDVGYRPEQPVDYSHKIHAGELGMDCRYCHVAVEKSSVASVPPTQVCMNCHTMVAAESEKLKLVMESWASGTPIEWVRIHKLPQYVYFNHSAHINAGVGCESCHGNIASMDVVQQEKPLNMEWCLDCHRNPEPNLRPRSEITMMNWTPAHNQQEFANKIITEKHINAPVENCAGCHR